MAQKERCHFFALGFIVILITVCVFEAENLATRDRSSHTGQDVPVGFFVVNCCSQPLGWGGGGRFDWFEEEHVKYS